MLRLLFILLLLLFLWSVADAHKEYPDSLSYHQALPMEKHDGKDGNWFISDRNHHNEAGIKQTR